MKKKEREKRKKERKKERMKGKKKVIRAKMRKIKGIKSRARCITLFSLVLANSTSLCSLRLDCLSQVPLHYTCLLDLKLHTSLYDAKRRKS
jgi:hypothetical protein